MADIFGTSLAFVDETTHIGLSTLGNVQELAIGSVWDISAGTSKSFVFVGDRSTTVADTINVFTIDDAGNMRFVDNAVDLSGLAMDGLDDLHFFTSGTFGLTPLLAVTGHDDDGVSIFRVDDAYPYLTLADTEFDAGTPNNQLDGASVMTSYRVPSTFGFTTYLAVHGYIDEGLSIYSVSGTGVLSLRQYLVDDPGSNIFLGQLSGMTTAYVGDRQFIFGYDENQNALTVLRVEPDGSVREWGSRDDIFSLLGGELAVKVMGETAYIYTADAVSREIIVLGFDGFRTFEVQRIKSEDALYGVEAAKMVDIGSRSFVFVAAEYTDQVFVFEIDQGLLSATKGQLAHVDTLDADTFGLDAPTAIEQISVGGVPYLLIGEEHDESVSVFAIGGGDDVLNGTRDDDVLRGFAGDDIGYGREGADDIDLGEGDDVAYGGSGDDTVTLSAGQDVSYGGSGIDLFDTSGWGSGVTVDFIRYEVVFADGTEQFVSGFENIQGTTFRDILVGSDGANDIQGGEGDDLIRGRAGDDVLSGDAGNDQLVGADGDDTLGGGQGDDRLAGGAGNDDMSGGAGGDKMFGGGGNDIMSGGDSGDLIKGNDGDDTITGEGGNDRIEGNQGDDFLRGQGGNDTVIGGGGRDRINGGAGTDELTGGSAIDTFVFQTVANGGGGTNTVTDFQDGLDLLDLSDYSYASAAAALSGAVQSGAHVNITLADGQVIVLLDTGLGDLSGADLVL